MFVVCCSLFVVYPVKCEARTISLGFVVLCLLLIVEKVEKVEKLKG